MAQPLSCKDQSTEADGWVVSVQGKLHFFLQTEQAGPNRKEFRGTSEKQPPLLLPERQLRGKLEATSERTLQDVYEYTRNFKFHIGFRGETLIKFYDADERQLLGEFSTGLSVEPPRESGEGKGYWTGLLG